jgi:uncharacterized protein (TIGR02646 family)
MKYIKKEQEPDFLSEYRKKQEEENKNKTHKQIWESFGKTKESQTLWNILWKEQGGICAYCGSLIDNSQQVNGITQSRKEFDDDDRDEKNKKRREHLNPKSEPKYKDIILSYYNLTAVCQGNENHGRDVWHCDKEKQSKEISIFPTDVKCEDFFHYDIKIKEDKDLKEVEIIGIGEEAEDTIKKLRLDIEKLNKRRYIAKVEADEFVSKNKKSIEVKRILNKNEKLIELIEKRINNIYHDLELSECCFVTKFFLQKRLSYLKSQNFDRI